MAEKSAAYEDSFPQAESTVDSPVKQLNEQADNKQMEPQTENEVIAGKFPFYIKLFENTDDFVLYNVFLECNV